MSDSNLSFHHIHLISADAHAAAKWYVDMLSAEIVREFVLRDAPQINVQLGGLTLLIRGPRPGETPGTRTAMTHFDDYSSHNDWGTDHFGFAYDGDLLALCEELCEKGAEFAVEPWEFRPGAWLCYLAAPDGVSIEIVQRRR
jgi:catechol 2,3-dioxygenase-like lactoylglutathione lyase family enzyme